MNVINNPKMSNWSQSENKIPFIRDWMTWTEQ